MSGAWDLVGGSVGGQLAALHLGRLHAHEQVLVVGIAVVPVIALVAAIIWQERRGTANAPEVTSAEELDQASQR